MVGWFCDLQQNQIEYNENKDEENDEDDDDYGDDANTKNTNALEYYDKKIAIKTWNKC